MARVCGHPTLNGAPCKHLVADPSQPDCGRHSAPAMELARGEGGKSIRGHVWPKKHIVSQWCLKHDNAEYRALVELGLAPPCFRWLGRSLRHELARNVPEDQLEWATSDQSAEVRLVAARRMPPEQLGWATQDKDWQVRLAAAQRMPPDQLRWASRDPETLVRREAVYRMPPDQLEWATWSGNTHVRIVAAQRMPVDQLDWALRSRVDSIRRIAQERVAQAARR